MSLNVIKLIEELITQAQKMEYEESGKELDAILRTAKLRIRKIFGDESTHLKDISSIRFSPVAYSSSNRDRAFQKQFRKGKYQLINLFYTLIEDIELSDQLSQTEEDNNLTVDIFSDKIFVVHGHDNEMKQSTARILEKIGLEPIILHEQANEGKTIIEKFLANAGQVSFAVVLLSPDDVGRSVNSDIEKTRARQNVILELGFFIGRLGRERVFVLHKRDDNFELPSDIFGVLYTPYDGDAGGWQFQLVKELKNVGYDIDMNDLA